MSEWKAWLSGRLVRLQQDDGGWAYGERPPSAPEPTALACIALSQSGGREAAVHAGLSYLLRLQQRDGRFAMQQNPKAGWPTALAVLAAKAAHRAGLAPPPGAINRAVDWLLESRGKGFRSDPTIYGHDTELVGWSWIDDTHTWVEPTAYALLALRAVDRADHPRYRDGIAVLKNRAIAGGGWNYGNSRMFGADLRPFPETTGLALAAMCGEPRDETIERSLIYLSSAITQPLSAMSVAWPIIGLETWSDRPADADTLLEQASGFSAKHFDAGVTMDNHSRGIPQAPCEQAMLLIAAVEPNAITRLTCKTESAGAPS